MKTHLRHRQIDFYDKKTDELVGEIDLSFFDIKTIKERFEINSNDPLIFKPYQIDINKIDLFPDIEFDLIKYDYYLACYSDYSIRTNQIMDNYLQRLHFDFGDNRIELPERLEEIADNDLVFDNDCIL